MPRPRRETARVPVLLRLEPALLKALDSWEPARARTAKIVALIEQGLSERKDHPPVR